MITTISAIVGIIAIIIAASLNVVNIIKIIKADRVKKEAPYKASENRFYSSVAMVLNEFENTFFCENIGRTMLVKYLISERYNSVIKFIQCDDKAIDNNGMQYKDANNINRQIAILLEADKDFQEKAYMDLEKSGLSEDQIDVVMSLFYNEDKNYISYLKISLEMINYVKFDKEEIKHQIIKIFWELWFRLSFNNISKVFRHLNGKLNGMKYKNIEL